ncbi:MAG: minor capsid protein [Bdellovibrionales bacterium]|nr:minor capsid protein [Bdellovibrionales bacterium]
MEDKLSRDMVLKEAVEEFKRQRPVVGKTVGSIWLNNAPQTLFPFMIKESDMMLERIEKQIAEGLERGETPSQIEERIKEEAPDWTATRAEMVQRTNRNTGMSSGRLVQARNMGAFSVGFEITTAGDVDVRPTHQALDGLRSDVHDVLWEAFITPFEWNCRCGKLTITRVDPRAKDLGNFTGDGVFRRWHPKLGFDFSIGQLIAHVRSFGKLPAFIAERV